MSHILVNRHQLSRCLRFDRAYVLVNQRPSHAYMEILEIEILPFQPASSPRRNPDSMSRECVSSVLPGNEDGPRAAPGIAQCQPLLALLGCELWSQSAGYYATPREPLPQ
jgi:hypothetical protein